MINAVLTAYVWMLVTLALVRLWVFHISAAYADLRAARQRIIRKELVHAALAAFLTAFVQPFVQ